VELAALATYGQGNGVPSTSPAVPVIRKEHGLRTRISLYAVAQPQPLEMLQILEALRTAGGALHPDQVVETGEWCCHAANVRDQAMLPGLVERRHTLDERVQVERKVVLAEENLRWKSSMLASVTS
jgi:hypothetical protein